jgi:hypothetical protein
MWVKLSWSLETASAFDRGKQVACPDFQAVVSLAVDDSDSHVGAVLQQREAGALRHLFSVQVFGLGLRAASSQAASSSTGRTTSRYSTPCNRASES